MIIDYLVSKNLKKLQYSVLQILQGNALSQMLLIEFQIGTNFLDGRTLIKTHKMCKSSFLKFHFKKLI